MTLALNIVFFLVIAYYVGKFLQVIWKMKQTIILPSTSEDLVDIRLYPQKAVEPPTFSAQKVGITIYSFMLLFMVAIFTVGIFTEKLDWTFYLLVFLPLTYSNELLNLVAVVEEGILHGTRFIPWQSMKSYSFIPITINHKYYGYSAEVNDGYELRVKAKGRSVSWIVTSNEMKTKLEQILDEHIKSNR